MFEQYQQLIRQQVLCEDKAQLAAVTALSSLTTQLVQSPAQNTTTSLIIATISQLFKVPKPAVRGLYFHGRVGRGKTMLMDLFYQNIQLNNKKRIHFHRFMEDVHRQLNELTKQNTSSEEPLLHIAKQWAQEFDLLCFDEFYVSDIGDAMILSGLFAQLFACGVTLVATSNCKPEQLYRNGLQRERFLPTIALINQHCQVISIDGDLDHRLATEHTSRYSNYFLTAQAGEYLLSKRYQALTNVGAVNKGLITINYRQISYLGLSNKVIWFDFFALCAGPRSQRDYIKLADQFDIVLLSNVPKFSGKLVPAVFSGVEDRYQRSGVLLADLRQLDDEARRFIALVDEFYDRKVKLIVSAEVDIDELYQGQQLAFEFQRCQSRLFEMQND
ncbi:cell division protein ZapE [Colwellia sp. 39_35_sub15_T18]|nr:cell division protein ZapE [Colwellia sp. 39_35_sub15_T18]